MLFILEYSYKTSYFQYTICFTVFFSVFALCSLTNSFLLFILNLLFSVTTADRRIFVYRIAGSCDVFTPALRARRRRRVHFPSHVNEGETANEGRLVESVGDSILLCRHVRYVEQCL